MFISNFESKFLQKSNYKIEEMELIDVPLIKFNIQGNNEIEEESLKTRKRSTT